MRLLTPEFFDEVDSAANWIDAVESDREGQAAARTADKLLGDMTVGHDDIAVHQPPRADPLEPGMVIHLDATDSGDRFLKDLSSCFQSVLPDLALSVFEFENRNTFANGKDRPACSQDDRF